MPYLPARASFRRTCAADGCKKNLPPHSRSDARFCSRACQDKDRDRRVVWANAEKAFKTTKQIAQVANENAFRLQQHRIWARQKNAMLDRWRVQHIRFMGTQAGVLIVHADGANDLPWPDPWASLWTKNYDDLALLAAVAEAVTSEQLGRRFRDWQHDKEFQSLLQGPISTIQLFVVELGPQQSDWSPPLSASWADHDKADDQNRLSDRDNDPGDEPSRSYIVNIENQFFGGGFKIRKRTT